MFNPKINPNTHVSVQSSALDEQPTGLANRVAMFASENTPLLKATASFPVNAEQQPNTIGILKKAVDVQKQLLKEQPGSSKDEHLHALDVLEQRNFQPSSSTALHIPLTGKALGGAPPRRSGRPPRSGGQRRTEGEQSRTEGGQRRTEREQRRTELLLDIGELENFVRGATEQVGQTEDETIPEFRALFAQAEPGSAERLALYNQIYTASNLVITLRMQATAASQLIKSKREELERLGG